jgi:hypothetical protein
MPWYRLPLHGNSVIHVRGSKKLPAGCCAPIEVEGRRVQCLTPSSVLCDGDAGGGRTCDRPLCTEHAHHVGPDTDYCAECFAVHQAAQPQGGLFPTEKL